MTARPRETLFLNQVCQTKKKWPKGETFGIKASVYSKSGTRGQLFRKHSLILAEAPRVFRLGGKVEEKLRRYF